MNGGMHNSLRTNAQRQTRKKSGSKRQGCLRLIVLFSFLSLLSLAHSFPRAAPKRRLVCSFFSQTTTKPKVFYIHAVGIGEQHTPRRRHPPSVHPVRWDSLFFRSRLHMALLHTRALSFATGRVPFLFFAPSHTHSVPFAPLSPTILVPFFSITAPPASAGAYACRRSRGRG